MYDQTAMTPGYGRRRFIRDLVLLAGATRMPVAGAEVKGRLRFMASGQAAIQYDLRLREYPDLARFGALFGQADICFTDLETAVAEPGTLEPTNKTGFLKAAPPATLDCLRSLSFNMLALSNNHSWDLGAPGILSTLEAVRARAFTYAGTGEDLAQAAMPAYRDTVAGKVALVAMASGAVREGAAATPARPGVNEVKLDAGGAIDAGDAERVLTAIREAARNAAYVFCYQHSHYWEKDFRVTPEWQRAWARRCIDAGASAFVSHGAPLLHGIEIYRSRPVFFDLGSFIFQSRTEVGYYPPEVWESVIADCVFDDGKLVAMELVPVVLNERGISAGLFFETRGRPQFARGADAARVLERLRRLSLALGTDIRISSDVGRVLI